MAGIIPAILAPLGTYLFIKVSHQLDILEESLRQNEERFRILSELAEEGIVIHDKGTIIDANKTLSRMFGYELSEVTGAYAEKFFTPDSWKTMMKHMAEDYEEPYEVIGIKKDGGDRDTRRRRGP